MRYPRKTAVAHAILLAALGPLAASAQAQDAQTAAATAAAREAAQVAFEIPAQPLPAALAAFNAQSDWKLDYSASELPAGATSRALSGRFVPIAALRRLLADTPHLNIRVVGRNALALEATPLERLNEVVVVGSAFKGPDRATPVTILTSEELAAQGFTTIDDVFRRLPQSFGSTSRVSQGMGEAEYGDKLKGGALGATAINLRGLGSRSTLVLVNGRRRAGSSVDGGAYTDVQSIPIAQIDRIEILADGASAIYGADAVAGVVNIVLRTDYAGGQIQARIEKSAAGGDLARLTGAKTFSWEGGTLTAALTLERDTPPDANRYTPVGPSGPGDMVALGGVNTRTPWVGTPGSVLEPTTRNRLTVPGDFLGYIPRGQNGENLQPGSLTRPANPDAFERSFLPKSPAGRPSDSGTLRLEAQHDLSPTTRLVGGLTLAQRSSHGDYAPTSFNEFSLAPSEGIDSTRIMYVPANNVYNRFGRPIYVAYSFEKELEGLSFRQNNQRTNADGYVGLSGKLPRTWDYEITLSQSGERSDDDEINGAPQAGKEDRARVAAQRRLLRNINVFGDGQDPAVIEKNRALLRGLLLRTQTQAVSRATGLEAKLRGEVFTLPTVDKPAQLALGAQARREVYDQSSTNASRNRNILRDSQALYGELRVPVLRDQPMARDLSFTVAARFERFRQRGRFLVANMAVDMDPETGVDTDLVASTGLGPDITRITGLTPAAPGGDSADAQIERRYSNLSPLARITWAPNEDVRLRATWGRSFLTPSLQSQFGSATLMPLASAVGPTGETAAAWSVLQARGVVGGIVLNGSSPGLKPQTAQTLTAGFDLTPRFIPGLQAAATYTHTRFDNYISDPMASGDYTTLARNLDALPKDSYVIKNGFLLWDLRETNFARRTSRSLDLSVNYAFATAWGDWSVDAAATRTFELSSQRAPWSKVDVFSDTEFGPSRFKGNLGVSWNLGPMGVTGVLAYASGHRVTQPATSDIDPYGLYANGISATPSLTAVSTRTFDLQGSYRMPKGDGGLTGGWTLILGAKNLFDTKPAFVNNVHGYVSNRFDPRGRVVYLDITKQF